MYYIKKEVITIKLKIKNFMVHKELKIELDGFSIISGENGAGKSAIFHAINWLVNGGTNNFVTYGEKQCSVELTFSSLQDLKICRKVDNNKYSVEVNDIVVCTLKDSLQDLNVKLPIDFFSQFDKLFLLSETPKSRAEILNEVFGIASLELALITANMNLKNTNKKLTNIENIMQEEEIKKLKMSDTYEALEKANAEYTSSLHTKNLIQELEATKTLDKVFEVYGEKAVKIMQLLEHLDTIKLRTIPKSVSKNVDTKKLDLIKELDTIKIVKVAEVKSTVDTKKLDLIKELANLHIEPVETLLKNLAEISETLKGGACPLCQQIL